THRDSAQRRHRGEGSKTAATQVRALATPDVLDRLRAAERFEAVVIGNRALPHQHSQPRDGCNPPHRFVIAILSLATQQPQMGQVLEGIQPGRREGRTVPKETEPEQTIEPDEARETGVGEWTVDHQEARPGLRAHEAVFDFSAMPHLENWDLV